MPNAGAAKRGMRSLQIGNLARRIGCTIDTIRYYEKIGLLRPPARRNGQFRVYSTEDVRRLMFIRRARELGFAIHQVRAMLRLAEQQAGACAEVKTVATDHLADIRAKIADLRTMEGVLASLIAECDSGRSAACPLIERLTRITEAEA